MTGVEGKIQVRIWPGNNSLQLTCDHRGLEMVVQTVDKDAHAARVSILVTSVAADEPTKSHIPTHHRLGHYVIGTEASFSDLYLRKCDQDPSGTAHVGEVTTWLTRRPRVYAAASRTFSFFQ